MTRAKEQFFQVIQELHFPISLADGDLEDVVPGDEGGQPCKGLLAAATYPDQHGAATFLLNGAIDSHQVHQGIFKEHQIHGFRRVLLIEFGQIPR